MPKFTDDEGRDWTVAITVRELKTLRELRAHPEELLRDELKGLAEVVSDEERLVQVLYGLCHAQAEKAGVSPEEFAGGFKGDAIVAGRNAFVQALVDFSHGQRRAALTALAQKLKEVDARMTELVTEAIGSIPTETLIEQVKIAEQNRRASTNSATGSPASAESIPPP